jgi:hypothetical protein
MTFTWPEGEPIAVEMDILGTPLHFVWAEVTHPVARVLSRWRLDEEWWRTRIWREYFKLYTSNGLLVVIYRDFMNNQWFLQSLYD